MHRDLKTSNILLDENNHCHLADFGTCRESMANRTFVGTVPIPPEVLAQLQQPATTTYDGAAADIYSLGVILYELLPKNEYHRSRSGDLLDIRMFIRRHVRLTFRHAEYENLILVCLQPKPTDRLTAVQIIERLYALLRQYQSETKLQQEMRQCSACRDRPRSIRFFPCQHKLMCLLCWQQLQATKDFKKICDVCKKYIQQIRDDDDDDDDDDSTFIIST